MLTNRKSGGSAAVEELFYKALFAGLVVCGGVVSLIGSIIVWRKMYLAGKSFAELGSDGNALIFMGVLALICFAIAWRIRVAKKKLSAED